MVTVHARPTCNRSGSQTHLEINTRGPGTAKNKTRVSQLRQLRGPPSSRQPHPRERPPRPERLRPRPASDRNAVRTRAARAGASCPQLTAPVRPPDRSSAPKLDHRPEGRLSPPPRGIPGLRSQLPPTRRPARPPSSPGSGTPSSRSGAPIHRPLRGHPRPPSLAKRAPSNGSAGSPTSPFPLHLFSSKSC